MYSSSLIVTVLQNSQRQSDYSSTGTKNQVRAGIPANSFDCAEFPPDNLHHSVELEDCTTALRFLMKPLAYIRVAPPQPKRFVATDLFRCLVCLDQSADAYAVDSGCMKAFHITHRHPFCSLRFWSTGKRVQVVFKRPLRIRRIHLLHQLLDLGPKVTRPAQRAILEVPMTISDFGEGQMSALNNFKDLS